MRLPIHHCLLDECNCEQHRECYSSNSKEFNGQYHDCFSEECNQQCHECHSKECYCERHEEHHRTNPEEGSTSEASSQSSASRCQDQEQVKWLRQECHPPRWL